MEMVLLNAVIIDSVVIYPERNYANIGYFLPKQGAIG